MTADIATEALAMRRFRRQPVVGVIFHGGWGSHYASHAMHERLFAYGMTASMSREGDCWDNPPSESSFDSLKGERLNGASFATRADAQTDLFEYIEVFCNRRRRHSTLGYCSPHRFLQDWISKHEDQQPKSA